MWWLKLLVTGCVAALAAAQEVQDNERRWSTWAEILGGDPPKESIQSSNSVVETNSHNYVDDVEKNNNNNNEYVTDYDYAYVDDYDENFFNNPDYIYVDTEDDNYKPPEVQEEPSEVSQTADRRTLDFFYHLFADQFRNDNGGDRPQRNTVRRPSLIEDVFRTIDNHILEDLQQWSTYTAQQDAQVANAEAQPSSPHVGLASSIKPISPENSDIVLVTDDQGHEHLVTINDIVSSLSHLDERTLTNLLLSPQPSHNSRSSDIQFSPSTNIPTVVAPTTLGQVPVVLGTQKIGQVGPLRPVRHTGPVETSKEKEDEVYVVQDENGQVQLVTLEDIIASLALLDDESLGSLLFQDSTIPAVVSPTTSNGVSPTTSNRVSPTTSNGVSPADSQPDTPFTIPSAVLPSNKSSSDSDTSKQATPTVSTDFDGNVRVLAHPGSVIVDFNNLSGNTVKSTETEQLTKTEPEAPTPLLIGGSLVRTDDNGDIYITPDPDKPFTLDIESIIALAEQADNQARASKVPPSKSTKNILQEEEDGGKEKETEEDDTRGHELLSYLAGIENFLPAAILPDPIRTTVPNTHTQNEEDPAGVSAFRSSLLQAINQQTAVPQPPVPQATPSPQPVLQPFLQRFVQPVLRPIVQAVTVPAAQASSEGIGASFSRLLSSLVGQSPSQQIVAVPQIQTGKKSPEQEYIKLVVRQQAPNSLDTYFGDVTIPLPQAIHFQHTSKPKQNADAIVAADATEASTSPKVDVPSPLQRLSSAIQRTLRLQANNVPRFILPEVPSTAATQRSLPIARSDSGPVYRTDNKVTNTYNTKSTVRPTARSPIRTVISKPIAPTPYPVTKKPVSITSLLAGLPSTVLESLRKQMQNARTDSSQEVKTEVSEEQEQELHSPAGEQLDRSSYHAPPVYGSAPPVYGIAPPVYGSSVGGHGHGHGSSNPLLDIYLLADLTKVLKVGDTNLSVKSPIIGDPAYFVDTRHSGYH